MQIERGQLVVGTVKPAKLWIPFKVKLFQAVAVAFELPEISAADCVYFCQLVIAALDYLQLGTSAQVKLFQAV